MLRWAKIKIFATTPFFSLFGSNRFQSSLFLNFSLVIGRTSSVNHNWCFQPLKAFVRADKLLILSPILNFLLIYYRNTKLISKILSFKTNKRRMHPIKPIPKTKNHKNIFKTKLWNFTVFEMRHIQLWAT